MECLGTGFLHLRVHFVTRLTATLSRRRLNDLLNRVRLEQQERIWRHLCTMYWHSTARRWLSPDLELSHLVPRDSEILRPLPYIMTNDEIPNDERMTKPEAPILCGELMPLGHTIAPLQA